MTKTAKLSYRRLNPTSPGYSAVSSFIFSYVKVVIGGLNPTSPGYSAVRPTAYDQWSVLLGSLNPTSPGYSAVRQRSIVSVVHYLSLVLILLHLDIAL